MNRINRTSTIVVICAWLAMPSIGLAEDIPSPQETTTESAPTAPKSATPQESTPSAPEETTAAQKAGEPAETPETAGPQTGEPVTFGDISIVSRRPLERPQGTDISSAPRRELDLRPTRNFLESVQTIPGITTQQGNGPRDYNISIRGFGAKTSFGIRNVKMYEDGIAQTQSDGLSRLDLHDPWFMQGVDVLKGPSSSLYDNYALGGVLFFRTRRGSDIMGTETDVTLGSFGYQKYALAYGTSTPNVDVAFFGSYAGEDGYIDHSGYFTTTENLNFRYHIDDRQDIYFKAINNDLNADVPTRLTLNQFNTDPRQAGSSALTRDQGRQDRRTIFGALYERQIDASTLLTMEGDFDVKDINQTFNQISANINPNFKHYTDLRHEGRLLGAPLRSTLGFFVNYMEQEGQSFANLNDSHGTRGVLLQNTHGSIFNIGGRARAEWDFVPYWTAVAGLGVESSEVKADVINYTSAGAVNNRVSPDQTYRNYAPEVSVTHHTDGGSKQWVRLSTGYGIPGISNITTDLSGNPGVNTNLKPQTNEGIEIGTDTQVNSILSLQLVGFWTIFHDEIISQSNTNGSYSVNADRSQYRGVEAGATVKPFKGGRLTTAYTFMDATYLNFNDQYLVTGVPQVFPRDGKEVPAVPMNLLYAQAAYDDPSGFGAWIETTWMGDYYADNLNALTAPGYNVWNANLHYIHAFPETSWFHFIKGFIELDNLFDRTFAASTAVVSNSPCGDTTSTPFSSCVTTMAASGQAFFAGNGRAVYGGVTVGF
jgi:iron complex outermembrane receptor protein